jgi:anti-anti-sigma factor
VPSTPEPEADALFEIRAGTTLGAVVIDVVGEVDMATAPRLAAALDPARYTAQRVVVNLSEVSFIDSSGLNALVAHARDLTKKGVVTLRS